MTKRDSAISFSRLIALLLIILCHLLQHFYLSAWALILNVGVQVFLVISGYLYGLKNENVLNDSILFLKRSTIKILKKYISFLIVLLLVLTLIGSDGNGLEDILKWIRFEEPIDGYGHIWFIPYILMCYFLTPYILLIFKSHKKVDIMKLFLLLVLMEIIFDVFFDYFNPAWINCYIIGIFLGYHNCVKNTDNKFNKWKVFILILSCCLMLIRFFIKANDVDSKWRVIFAYFYMITLIID